MAPGTAAEGLARDLLEGADDQAMTGELTGWLSGSPRFRAFAEAHRDKIRKKLRSASDAEARKDVRAELRVAHLLLANRRLHLAFEAYGSTTGGPDFTVTFGRARFNLEVTRMRRARSPGWNGPMLTKLRQLPPSIANALLVAVDGETADPFDPAAASRALRDRADAKDEPFFIARGFEGSRAFYHRYLRLGGVFVWADRGTGASGATLWLNRSARIQLPERAARASLECLRAS